MEASAMDDTKLSESHLVSAAAFVEGGIQEACDDACSICLEDFCDSDPSTVTSCKHEFHLQCILEWCQRSSQCPMCWQPISLKDSTSQELLEAVEQERTFRSNRPRNATIFHHPALGEFELQHLPVGVNDAELEERIIQHLAAAAAMGRAHHISRREGHRNRSAGQGRPQFLVLSHPNAASSSPITTSPPQRSGDNEAPLVFAAASPTSSLMAVGEEPSSGTPPLHSSQAGQSPASASGSSLLVANQHQFSSDSPNYAGQSSPINQDRAGPSELQSFSESLKSKFNAVSTRYKESITKSTKGWKERLFSRNTAMADLGTEVRREVNAGIASVSRLMERLETRENGRTSDASVSDNSEGASVSEPGNPSIEENHHTDPLNDNNPSASCAATSGQN